VTDIDLARATFSKMPTKDRIHVDKLAGTLAIKANTSYIDALVVVMKLGQYFVTHAGVKR